MTDHLEDGLPTGWVVASLIEIAYLNPRWLDREPGQDEVVSFVPMAAVEAESGRLDSSSTRAWKEVSKGYTRFQEGDVLFAKITPCMENGKFAIAKGLIGGRAAGSTEFHVIRPIHGVEAKLLLYFLLRDSLRGEARVRMKGAAGQLRVPPEFLAQVQIPLPPSTEQRRIIGEIEKQFTRLEAAVGALKRVQANLKRYRASVLKAACEGRLVPTEAELARAEGRDYEPADKLLARILKERRARWEADQLAKMHTAGKPPKDDKWKAKYKEPAPPDPINLPRLPEGWLAASMDQITTQVGDVDHRMPTPASSGIPYISTKDFYGENGIDFDHAKRISPRDYAALARKIRPEPEDILLSRYGTVGEVRKVVWDVEFQASYSIAIAKPLQAMVTTDYVVLALKSEVVQAQMRRDIRASSQPDLGLEYIRKLALPLAPLAEQQRIVAEVERRLSVIDELEAVVETNLKRAERLRQAILKRAFEGKLVPQNPSDEPAGILLERVRAERARLEPQRRRRPRNETRTESRKAS